MARQFTSTITVLWPIKPVPKTTFTGQNSTIPQTKTIIVNGGDPLMVEPDYYWRIIDWLDEHNYDTSISLTTNLWPFYKKPKKWTPLFNNDRVGVTTSFQYGGGRLKGDYTEFTEEDFWKC